MTSASFDTPVVVIAYRRPHHVERLMAQLRALEPRHVLIVTDGPKPDHPDDARACEQTRRATADIDWPCRIEREDASENLGCGPRVRSGLDWVFLRVDRAIILEDDIDPHPSFFAWAAAALDTYADRDDVAMVAGHNPLVRWPGGTKDGAGFLSRRGGIYGWGTWARQWRAFRSAEIEGARPRSEAHLTERRLDAVLHELMVWYLQEANRLGPALSWDVAWLTWMVHEGRTAFVSSVNLIHNLGIGADATRQVAGHDLLHRLPRFAASFADRDDAMPPGAFDEAFERARTLLELLVRVENPAMARRLVRMPSLPIPREKRAHLMPFLHHEETVRWLDHLEKCGVAKDVMAFWKRAVEPPGGRLQPS